MKPCTTKTGPLRWVMLLWLATTIVRAQPALPYQTTVFSTREGLPHNTALALCQDRNGYLWIGTEAGLSRYNGYRFDNFLEAEGQRIGQVHALFEMPGGVLWIGTESGIFMEYLGKIRVVTSTLDSTYRQVRSFAWDAGRRQLWFACASGPYYFTESQLRLLKQQPDKPDIQPQPQPVWQKNMSPDTRVFALAVDEKGGLWAGNSKGLYYCNNQSLRQVWRSETINEITCILPAGKDSVYFGGNASTLMGDFNGQFRQFADSMYYVTDIFEHEGRRYFFSAGEMYRLEAQKIVKIWDHSIRVGISDVLIDREKNVWVATWEGLVKIGPKFFTQMENEDLQEIYGVGTNAAGDVVFGANHGVLHLLPNGNTLTNKTLQKKVCLNANLNDFYFDPANRCWIATEYEGLAMLEAGKIHLFGKREGLQDEGLFALLPTKNGDLWAIGDGGVSQVRLSEYDDARKMPEIHGFGFLSPQEGLVTLCCGVEDAEGGLWFGGNRGLFKMSNGGLEAIPSLAYNCVVTGMSLDRENNLWISTLGSGVLYCAWRDHAWQLIKTITEQDGLYSNNVLAILATSDHSIWLGYGFGMGRIEFAGLTKQRIRYFNHRDGFFRDGCRRMRILETARGMLWAVSPIGVCHFLPAGFARNEIPPLVRIRTVEIFNGTIDSQAFSDSLNAETGLPEGLALPYSLNHIRFVFDGLSLTNPDNNRFRFRLSGVDDNWRIPENADLQAIYPKLSPGEYTFYVEAANSDGVWSVQPVEFHFRILAPFWEKAWFWVLLAMLFVVLTVFIAMGRVRKIRRQEKEKTRLQTQLAELRVQALRSQINPHFIFNCLAGIQEYVLQEQFMEANDYLTRFARLLRLTLERADQNFISLGQELELLRLYLELENTRLRQQIDYQIHVSEDASEDTMKIPAFIIQPFVENAIWHGLMHRKGAKKLYVDIAVNGTPDVGSGEQKMLKIEVTDNGVGREMSARIGRNKLGSQESKGMGIITERIRLIYPKASIRYEDLYDDAQQSAGTRVCIKIPLD